MLENNGFEIKNIPIQGDLILAPMDGYTDQPFRRLTRKLGSAASYTEFLNAIDVVNDHSIIRQRASYQENERPVFFQLLDNDLERMVAAARKLLPLQPDGFDINLGCPARTVAGRGAGAGLLRNPQHIQQIITAIRREISLPLTAKMRIGWGYEEANEYLRIAKILEESGVDAIIVHGRTRQQGYTGQANWDAIAEVKKNVSIPVIGNGDVRTVDDISAMHQYTQCDGIMIGRAAITNPWIFSRRNRDQISQDEVMRLIHQHLQLNMEFYGMERGIILFRKFVKSYLQPFDVDKEEMTRLVTANNPGSFLEILNRIFTKF